MTNEELILKCKEKMLTTMSSVDVADVEQGGLKLLKFKNEHLLSMTDAIAITVGMFNHGMPELVFFYGPSSAAPDNLTESQLTVIEGEIGAVVTEMVETHNTLEEGTFYMEETNNSYTRLTVAQSPDEKLHPNFLLKHMFSTVAITGQTDLKVIEIVRVKSDGSSGVVHIH